MKSEDIYLKKINDKILALGKDITQVKDITYFKLFDYTVENNSVVHNLLSENKISDLENLPSNEKRNTSEDLLVFKFQDQNNHLRIVTVYDNDELWQDPQILNIY